MPVDPRVKARVERELEELENAARFLRDGRTRNVEERLETETELATERASSRASRFAYVPKPIAYVELPPPAKLWPTCSARTFLAFLGYTCLLVLLAVGAMVDGGTGAMPAGTTVVSQLGDFTIVSPDVVMHHSSKAAWYLVALGDPKVFAIMLLTITALALRRNDWRLAAVVSLAPISVMVLAECVAKPTFWQLNGGHYGFPSGHVAGAAAMCFAGVMFAARHFNTKIATVTIALSVLAVAGVMIGVVHLNMHPVKDAVGGLLFSVGMMALLSSAIFSESVDDTPRLVRATEATDQAQPTQ